MICLEECVAVVSVKSFISDTRMPCLNKLEQVLKKDKNLIQTLEEFQVQFVCFKWTYDLKY